jgi:hypothetical protein
VLAVLEAPIGRLYLVTVIALIGCQGRASQHDDLS